MTARAKPGDPRTRTQWQESVNLAALMLRIDAARADGLVTGGPEIDAARCSELVDRGAARGVRPDERAIEQALRAIAAESSVPH